MRSAKKNAERVTQHRGHREGEEEKITRRLSERGDAQRAEPKARRDAMESGEDSSVAEVHFVRGSMSERKLRRPKEKENLRPHMRNRHVGHPQDAGIEQKSLRPRRPELQFGANFLEIGYEGRKRKRGSVRVAGFQSFKVRMDRLD
jgi:hypothetical protein